MRGAWVEIIKRQNHTKRACMSLPVRGAWVEIAAAFALAAAFLRRSPCGERGLKSPPRCDRQRQKPSLPVRGAWVEIICLMLERILSASLPVRGAWVEIVSPEMPERIFSSLPVRGAWVEISTLRAVAAFPSVAPRAGSVG